MSASLACALALMSLTAAATGSMESVTIDTTPLIGHPAGPFSVVFTLTDGNGLVDGTRSVTVANVDFGGGSSLGSPFTSGDATGLLETSVTLTNNAAVSTFSQNFAPGLALQFSLSETATTPDDGGPTGLSVFIVDSAGVRIPTRSPVADFLYSAAVGWTAGPPELFGTDPSRAPTTGLPISIAAPTVVSPCASAVTHLVTMTRSGFLYNPGTERFSQTVRLTNIGGEPISGPVYLALDNLAAGVILANETGTTGCATPGGMPTIGVTPNGIGIGESVSTVLQFTNPNKGAMSYAARVLAGSSTR